MRIALLITLFCCSAFAQGFWAPRIGGTNLVYWQQFDRTNSDSTLNDSSGNGILATNINGSTIVSGLIGNAVSFNGSNQQISFATNLNPATISVSFWARKNTLSQVSFAQIVAKRNQVSTSPYNNWTIDLSTSGNVLEACITQNGGGGPDSGQWCVSAGIDIPTNTFMFVALTYDGATEKLYTNSVLSASRSVSITLASSIYPVRVGTGDAITTYFNGVVDDLRIYNRALTTSEILQLYNNRRGTP